MLRDITLRHAITSLLSLGAIGIAGLAAAGETDEPRLAALQQQLTQVQTQLQQLAQENRSLREGQHQPERRLAELAGAPGAVPVAAAPPPGAAEASQALPASPSALPGPATGEGARLWGYGEVYFADPTRDGRRSQADLARGVFGLGYSFDERTEFNSEFEVEHAVASASDVGEFEVEQFYVDRRLGDSVSVRGGLFLMPFGLLNEHHEPTRYYGVQRNFVETLIIPSTWREGGVSLRGDTPLGLGWNLGLTTGFDLSKWQFDQTFPAYASALALANSGVAPLQATHQELALANARHLTQYAAVSYYGVPARAPRSPIPASRCGRRTGAGRLASSTCRRSTRGARSASSRAPTRRIRGLRTRCRRPSTVTSCSAPTSSSSRAATARRASRASSATTSARATPGRAARWSRRDSCRSRAAPGTSATGRPAMTGSGPPGRTSTSARTWC